MNGRLASLHPEQACFSGAFVTYIQNYSDATSWIYVRFYNKHLMDGDMLLLWCVGSAHTQRQLLPSSADPAAVF